MIYDLVILGGGPAGVAAGVYAARKKMKTILITDGFGGQSLVSADIQNWIGIKSVSGYELAKRMEEQLRAQDIGILDKDLGLAVEKINGGFRVSTKKGEILETKTLLITTGSRRRKLEIPGESEFNGKGVAYCSTCDAPIFKDKKVAVIGSGNAGLEAVIDLLPYAREIYLFERGSGLRGDLVAQEKIKKEPRVKVFLGSEPKEILGKKIVTGMKYADGQGKEKELALDGVFVEIGSVPNTEIVKDLVKMNATGEILIDHQTHQTSQPGIWAAGDVTDVLYKQNNISMGDAVKAVLNIYETLNKK